jgi:hypothetical protein
MDSDIGMPLVDVSEMGCLFITITADWGRG